MMEYVAHVRKDDGGNWIVHSLEEHLTEVAKRAFGICEKFGSGSFGYLIGLWHDLGKYKPEFQERIGIKSGYDEEAHLEGKTAKSVKHAVSGAIHSLNKFKKSEIIKKFISLSILCHHSGLKNYGVDVNIQLEDEKEIQLLSNAIPNIPTKILEGIKPQQISKSFSDESLFIRMLFSALIDSDRLDTEKFMDPEKYKERYSRSVKMEELNEKLDQHLFDKQKKSEPTKVNLLRKKILQEVELKSNLKSGFYTLTVPTGGGKTLTSLSFALKHCLANQMERIIYAVPYLSIIEQTASIFKNILGESSVLEHHSSIDISKEKENYRNRLLTENWEHPLIVTTNVQLFESLFSSRTTKIRKLHNLANSVIILDEAQMIPPDFLQPIIKVLKELVKVYNVTILLCTATQPTLTSVKSMNFNFDGIDNALELAPNPEELFENLKRVKVHKPEEAKLSYIEIADKIKNFEQVLTIVNRKEDAIGIFNELSGEKYYLTTNLCGEHRRDILKKVKNHLDNKEPVYLVSTQLIEAGVDIDFPVVFRAMTGLDSIAQASGRCNREGKLVDEKNEEIQGDVFLFHPEKNSPQGHLRQTEDAGKACIHDFEEIIQPDAFKQYFNELFWRKGDSLDKYRIETLKENLYFEEINEKFKLINEDSKPVIVPYKNGKEIIESLRRVANNKEYIDYKIIQKAQRYIVNVRIEQYEKFRKEEIIKEVDNTIAILNSENYYDHFLGLIDTLKPEDCIL
jgi:CRISPR-associated endonuclease/helicase Cas3